MIAAKAQLRYYTAEEYLAMERESPERHEYIDGHIYAMAGESDHHGEICVNLTVQLGSNLKGSPCRLRSQNTKVQSGPQPKPGHSQGGFFSYPDVLAVCGERHFHDQHQDVLLNPNVIIEVLSKSTEVFDRGEKFIRYRTWLPSLTDYILVSQDSPVIEHYRRQPNDEWLLATISGLDAELKIGSIGCALKLSEIYDGVEFNSQLSEEIAEAQN
ncbi:MAG: Uma2 family endonuclease [Blastocatellia bacterium]